MKLALVTETFPPEVNGVSMTLGRLAEGLSLRGFEIQVARPTQSGECKNLDRLGGRISEFVVPGIPLPGYDGLRIGQPSAYRLLREWSRNPPDIIHVATEGPQGLTALWVASILGILASSTYHTNFHQYTGHYNIGLIRDFILVFLRIAHNSCGCTLSPTKQMANELKSLGFKNTGFLSRGVDTEPDTPERRDFQLRSEWGAKENDCVFTYVGRVASEKNIDLAVQSYLLAREKRSNALMVIVGDGPEKQRLKRVYPDIVFAGMRKGEDLVRHYASSDVFLFPSVTETFGNVVTEAMSSGLAVVTYDYAAGRELIEPVVNGYLVPFGESEDFRIQTVDLMGLPLDGLTKVRAAARKTALDVSWSRVVEDFQQSLTTVKKGDRKGTPRSYSQEDHGA